MKKSQLLKVRRPSERKNAGRSAEEPVRYVLVRPGQDPTVMSTNAYERLDVFQDAVGGAVEEAPYPRHLEGSSKYIMLVNEAGLQIPLTHNRWGIVGSFVVVGRGRKDWRGLTQDEAIEVVGHLAPYTVWRQVRGERPEVRGRGSAACA